MSTSDAPKGPKRGPPKAARDPQPGGSGPGDNKPKKPRNRNRGGKAKAKKEKELLEQQRKAREEEEKRRAEEERARQAVLEAARKRQALQEKKRQECAERVQQARQAVHDAHQRLEEFYQTKARRRQQRTQVLQDATRPLTTQQLKDLDSSLKKNGAFIRKINQNITDENVEALCRDIRLLNLNRYVSEVVAGIAEMKPKNSISAVARVCAMMHSRYADFATDLLPRLLKHLETPKSFEKDADRKAHYTRKRDTVKLFVELFLFGVQPDEDELLEMYEALVAKSKAAIVEKPVCINELLLQADWTRTAANELMGLYPQPFFQVLQRERQLKEAIAMQEAMNEAQAPSQPQTSPAPPTEERDSPADESDASEAPTPADDPDSAESKRAVLEARVATLDDTCPLIHADQQARYRALALEYLEELTQFTVQVHKKLRKTERANHNTITMRGELSEAVQAEYDKQVKFHERLLNGLHSLAELLNEEVPTMPEEDEVANASDGVGVAQLSLLQAQNEADGIFGDEDTRAFYEDLRPLREILPGVFFSGQDEENADEDSTPLLEEEALAHDLEGEDGGEDDPTSALSLEGGSLSDEEEGAAVSLDTSTPAHIKMEAWLKNLPKCVNRELIDNAAVEFCYFATKGTRKKLIAALYQTPWYELALLPYYSRLVATLRPVFPEIGKGVVDLLKSEFRRIRRKKDQLNMGYKIRNAQFLGELAKFRVCPPIIIFVFAEDCLKDFSHRSIEMLCKFLETCGRFLYRTPETHVRCAALLDRMMRLKEARHLDSQTETLIENAYYCCKPPERAAVQKVRPPVHEYIRHLLFKRLGENTLKEIARKLSKLDWPTHGDYLTKCILNLKNLSYSHIPLLATLVATLSLYYGELTPRVVDGALHRFYRGLAENRTIEQQMRVMNVRFLGELYIFQVVNSDLIFHLLHTLITYPCDRNEGFRIRLACTLITTCGEYFSEVRDKQIFTRYLVYFQCYYFSLPFVPYDIEFLMEDTLTELDRKFRRLKTPEEARKALDEVLAYEKAQGIVPPAPDDLVIKLDGYVPVAHEPAAPRVETNGSKEQQPAVSASPVDSQEGDASEGAVASPVVEPLKPPTPPPTEDEEFDSMLTSMMRDSMSNRKPDTSNASANMVMPMNLFRSTGSSYATPKTEGDNKIFRLLTRKGNKHNTCSVAVPSDSPLANRARDYAFEEEQRVIKQKVLEFEAKEEEAEDLDEDAAPYEDRRDRPKNKKPYRGKLEFNSLE